MAATRLQHALHELVVDGFLDQRTRRAGADFALIEGEQHQTFDGLVEEAIVGLGDIGKENIGRLAAQFQRGRNQIVGGGLGNDATCCRGTGEGDLGDAVAGGQRHAGFAAIAVDDVQHAGRQQIGNQFGQDQDADRGGFGRLQHHAVAGANGRSQFPGRHQDREVPGDDLADDAERFVEVIGHGGFVDVAQGAFLGAQATGEVAEVIYGQRNVGIQGFTDRFAVVHGFGIGQQFEVGFKAIGDLEQEIGALCDGGATPFVGSGMCGIQCQFDIFGAGAGVPWCRACR